MSLTIDSAPEVLSVQQVSELLGLGRRQTYAAVRSGDLPGTRIGGRWLIPKARLLERLGLAQENGQPPLRHGG